MEVFFFALFVFIVTLFFVVAIFFFISARRDIKKSKEQRGEYLDNYGNPE